jgi:hypothetical protein
VKIKGSTFKREGEGKEGERDVTVKKALGDARVRRQRVTRTTAHNVDTVSVCSLGLEKKTTTQSQSHFPLRAK